MGDAVEQSRGHSLVQYAGLAAVSLTFYFQHGSAKDRYQFIGR